MPAKYHQVSPDMWNRNTRRMSKDAVLALAYIRTCPHRLTEGLFQLAPEHIAADTPLTVPEAEAALVELVRCGEIAYDDLHEYVFDRRALRDYPLKYGTVKKGERKGEKQPDKRLDPFLARFDAMPDTHLKQELADVAWETSDALAEALAERGIWRSEDPTDGSESGRGGTEVNGQDSPSRSPSPSPSRSPSPSPSGGTSRDEPEAEASPSRDRAETSKSRDEPLRCVNAGQQGCEGTAHPDLIEPDGTTWCRWCAPSAVHMAARIRGAS